ncbi:HSP20-like chaperone [Kalaharituber pfeilii]|nr:HSP20-like chaperone [Kalaharituber pfeilii]
MPKCLNKGCGKEFTDSNEDCIHHPGPPIFHEGQKGWQCCKPRVLTFDEFLAIPPCTTGKHSTEAPKPAAPIGKPVPEVAAPTVAKDGTETYRTSTPLTQVAATAPVAKPQVQQVEKPVEQDDPSIPVLPKAPCKRRACKAVYEGPESYDTPCVHHPGMPIFHEGSKGYSCCKRKVLEFEEFLKIEGCKTDRHLFVGAPKSKEEEELVHCKNDFYQTYSDVIVSIFAKKVDKDKVKIEYRPRELYVDLPMPDSKRYKITFPLYGPIDPEKCTHTVMGTKVELKLKKADTTSWPTLRSDEATGEIIQIGQPMKM